MSLAYYQRYPRDFLEACIGLPFEVRCAFGLVLDLIYMRDGRLPDDARYIAGQLGCSVRKWKSIREALIAADKLIVKDEIISTLRSDNLTETSRKYQDKQAEIAGKPRKNKDLRQPKPSQSESEAEEKKPSVPSHENPSDSCRRGDDAASVREAFDRWNDLARRKGLPLAKALTAQRRRQIKARLALDGPNGWAEALAAVEASPLCLGDNERGWRADLDFVCQPKSFGRLREGSYAAKSGPGPPDPAMIALRARHDALLAGTPDELSLSQH